MRAALALFLQPRTPDSGGGNCGEREGGGVGDGSAAAALIAFIRRCLPSSRRRGMWTPLIGREGPARRGRHGPAPSPRSLLPRDSRPRRRAGPAPSRAPPPGTRIEACARGAAPAQWRPGARPAGGSGSRGLPSPPAYGPRAQRGRGLTVGSPRSLPRELSARRGRPGVSVGGGEGEAEEPGSSVRTGLPEAPLGLVSLARRSPSPCLAGRTLHPNLSPSEPASGSAGRNPAIPFPRRPHPACGRGNSASRTPSPALRRTPMSPLPQRGLCSDPRNPTGGGGGREEILM